MSREEPAAKYVKAAAAFDHHEGGGRGAAVAAGLDAGLTLLKETLYLRLHHDVERQIGLDSMLMPVSEMRSAAATKHEIELFQVAQTAAMTQQHAYVTEPGDWFLKWMIQLRLETSQPDAAVMARLDEYLSQTGDRRAKAFSNVLAKTLPESRRAPLVLFRLYPLAVEF